MCSLRRHRLVRLTDAGWSTVLQHAWDTQAQACLTHWAIHRLPLVVTRQPPEVAENAIALGLPSPLPWGKRRLALQVPRTAVLDFDAFPQLSEVLELVPASAEASLRNLAHALDACGVSARAFGSYGWQTITGLNYLRPESDLDLCIDVDGVAQADAVADRLSTYATTLPRLDGELAFCDGASVAWREWIEWRGGRTRAVMVKHLNGVALRHDAAWCANAVLAELRT